MPATHHSHPPPFVLAAAAAFLLIAGLAPGQTLSNFWLVPDGNTLWASASDLVGNVPSGSGSVPVALRFTEPLRANRGAFLTLDYAQTVAPQTWGIIDFELDAAADPPTNLSVTLSRPAGSGPFGTMTSTTNGVGGFVPGAILGVNLNVIATFRGGAFGGGVAYAATLVASGTVIAGYYHQTVHFTGTLQGPGFSLAAQIHLKQDFYPPSIVWDLIADSLASHLGPPAERIGGAVGFARRPATPNTYDLVNLRFDGRLGNEVIVAAPGMISTLTLDPSTRAVGGTASLLVTPNGGGTPCQETVTIVPGSGSFTGSVMDPTSVTLDLPLPCTGQTLHLALERPQVVMASGSFAVGTTATLRFRARPGDFYGCTLCASTNPGVNTLVGDIPFNFDALFDLWWSNLSVFAPNAAGIMGPDGEALITLPPVPALPGLVIFFGGGVLDPATGQFRSVTNSHRALLY